MLFSGVSVHVSNAAPKAEQNRGQQTQSYNYSPTNRQDLYQHLYYCFKQKTLSVTSQGGHFLSWMAQNGHNNANNFGGRKGSNNPNNPGVNGMTGPTARAAMTNRCVLETFPQKKT